MLLDLTLAPALMDSVVKETVQVNNYNNSKLKELLYSNSTILLSLPSVYQLKLLPTQQLTSVEMDLKGSNLFKCSALVLKLDEI